LTKASRGLKSFTYLYGDGDNWQHKEKVEKVLTIDLGLTSPLCLAGRNASPPEDVDRISLVAPSFRHRPRIVTLGLS